MDDIRNLKGSPITTYLSWFIFMAWIITKVLHFPAFVGSNMFTERSMFLENKIIEIELEWLYRIVKIVARKQMSNLHIIQN